MGRGSDRTMLLAEAPVNCQGLLSHGRALWSCVLDRPTRTSGRGPGSSPGAGAAVKSTTAWCTSRRRARHSHDCKLTSSLARRSLAQMGRGEGGRRNSGRRAVPHCPCLCKDSQFSSCHSAPPGTPTGLPGGFSCTRCTAHGPQAPPSLRSGHCEGCGGKGSRLPWSCGWDRPRGRRPYARAVTAPCQGVT